jgi:hypothetical protein
MRRVGYLACILAVACGSSSHVVVPDGPSNIVNLFTNITPDFIAYRNGGGGAWQTPTGPLGSPVYYDFAVDNDFEVVVVCDNGGSGSAFDAEQYGFTYAGDGPEVQAPCTQPQASPDVPSPTTITGTMVQAGTVAIGGVSDGSATGPWTYSIQMLSGVHDVLAIDTANNAVYDTGLMFGAGSATGPAIDTGSGGAPLVSQPLMISNLGSSTLQVLDTVCSTDCELVSDGSAAIALSMPLSELTDFDAQFFQVVAEDAVGFRETSLDVFGPALPPTDYPLLPDFVATFSDGTASWMALPTVTYTTVNLLVTSSTSDQAVTVTPSWVVATGATSLSFDTSAPGYLPAWQVDPTMAGITLTQSYNDTSSGVSYLTQTTSGVTSDHKRGHRNQSFAPHVH